MKITNKHNLPGAYYRAACNDPYDNGGSDFTPSTLAIPPRAYAILKNHADDVEVDCSELVAIMLGKGTHKALESGAREGVDIVEKRFFMDFVVDGVSYKISAQVDVYESDTKTLYDWKTTKSGAFSKKNGQGKKKPEWIAQMNVGAEIMRRQPEPIQVDKIVICGLLKDWFKDMTDPPQEIMQAELPIWPSEKVNEYIETRVRLHVAALKSLPVCKENWGGGRCALYCEARSACTQFQESLKTGIVNKGEVHEIQQAGDRLERTESFFKVKRR